MSESNPGGPGKPWEALGGPGRPIWEGFGGGHSGDLSDLGDCRRLQKMAEDGRRWQKDGRKMAEDGRKIAEDCRLLQRIPTDVLETSE